MSEGSVLPECDYEQPESVVRAFIAAMHGWEVESKRLSREAGNASDPAAYWVPVTERMNAIFKSYCTRKERPHGRQGSFQDPPEYDPSREQVLRSEVEKRRVMVDTERQAIFAGGRHRYVLLREGGKWLIDSVKQELQGRWERGIL
ncbi:MAG: NTF2 fold immunity protein [Myxococcota bacterium]